VSAAGAKSRCERLREITVSSGNFPVVFGVGSATGSAWAGMRPSLDSGAASRQPVASATKTAMPTTPRRMRFRVISQTTRLHHPRQPRRHR
jgi:hypothetical protein